MKALHSASGTGIGYNPGVSYQGGQFLAQGIGQAGSAIAEGLQRYAANREEAAALDTRFESTAKPLMEKLSLYGQLADETSPAAALLDKSADWHKLGSSQKKVLLADMMILGDKTEAEQRRKEEDNKWRALQQFHQDQFAETQNQHREMLLRNDLDRMDNRAQRSFENVRQMNADQRAEGEFGLRKDIHADTIARFADEKRVRDTQRGAVGGFLRDFNQLAEGPQFNGTGMQRPMGQFEAYRAALGRNPEALSPQMVDNLGTMAVSEDRARAQSALGAFAPTLGTKSVTLADGRVVEIPYGTTSNGGAHWMPDVVKPRPGDGVDEAAPPDPILSPDGKLLWDARTRAWKQLRSNAGDAIEKLFPKASPASQPAAGGERKAEGGYIVGRVYGGKRYLGGSPTSAGNWEAAR